MTPMLSGAWNFRDVAETTGIRRGVLYRSSELSRLTDDGRDTLRELGITDVADLRSNQEVQRRGPGQVPNGVAVHLLPFHFDYDADQDAPHEHTFQRVMSESPNGEDVTAAAKRYMTEVYEEFPELPGAHTAVRQVISLLGRQGSDRLHRGDRPVRGRGGPRRGRHGLPTQQRRRSHAA